MELVTKHTMNEFLSPQKYDTMLGFICGTLGWIIHTAHFSLLQVNFSSAALAITMAFLSGAAGVLGKHCIVFFLKWYKNKMSKTDKGIIYKKKK